MLWFSNKLILAELEKQSKQLELLFKCIQVIDFKVTLPEPVSVFCVSQEGVFIMGTKVKVFLYEVAINAVPEDSDAVQQELKLEGVYQDPENLTVDQVIVTGPEATTQTFKAADTKEVKLSLSYVDDVGNRSLLPQEVIWTVEDQIGPVVPEGAIGSVIQKDQEMIELPDVEPDPEPEPE